MSNPTDPTPAAGTANVPDGKEGQPQAGQPPADGAVAEGQPAAGGAGKPADDAGGVPQKGEPGQPTPGDAGGEGGAGDPAGGGKEPEGAPESYEDFTLPEGFALADDDREALVAFGRAHNLSQSAAQEALDLATAHVQKLSSSLQADAEARIAQWAEQAKTDPLVGGAGYESNVKVAQDAIAKFGDPDLKQAFEEYGLGNHPAFIRFAYRVGKATGEGGFVHGQGNEQPAKPANKEAALAARIQAEQERARGK